VGSDASRGQAARLLPADVILTQFGSTVGSACRFGRSGSSKPATSGLFRGVNERIVSATVAGSLPAGRDRTEVEAPEQRPWPAWLPRLSRWGAVVGSACSVAGELADEEISLTPRGSSGAVRHFPIHWCCNKCACVGMSDDENRCVLRAAAPAQGTK